MQTNSATDNQAEAFPEAVVAAFESQMDAHRVAASLRGPDLDLQQVSRRDPTAADEMPDIVYDQVDHIENDTIAKGVIQGGAIGAGSGLLLLGIPGVNLVAPVAGALAGMFIGGVAGADETNRSIELPNEDDYQQMLLEGKSFIVIAGDEASRMKYAAQMLELGALKTYQHPPVRHAVRQPNDQT